jgi:23S rRNA (adenine2030-N6)-methyltransferase
MLSYRHAFHAGNHADVLKHAVLVHLLAYLAQKDKPYWYVDTHAGAAGYALDEAWAQKNAEFDSGIGRLWPRGDLPPLLAAYVERVRSFNPDGVLRSYPGSSQLALRLMREQDRMRLFELHSTEGRLLKAHYAKDAPRVMVQAGDGFDGLKSVLPPPSRRGLVLVDPSYEDKRDYGRARAALEDALQRFATGTYVLWYPIVQRRESQQFPEALKRLQRKDWLHVSLSVKSPAPDGYGLYGSGLFVINPAWTLPAALQDAMPYLVEVLGQDAGAVFRLESGLA